MKKPRARISFPMQPIVIAKDGIVRFQENRIVSALFDATQIGRQMDRNAIAVIGAHGGFSAAEQMQLAQLIGYSVSGFGDLPYVDRDTLRRADRKAKEVLMTRKSRRVR